MESSVEPNLARFSFNISAILEHHTTLYLVNLNNINNKNNNKIRIFRNDFADFELNRNLTNLI